MIYLPPLRRFLVPVIVFVTIVIVYRAVPVPTSLPALVFHPPPAPPQGIHVPISNVQKPLPNYNSSENHLSPPNRYFYSYEKSEKVANKSSNSILWQPVLDPNFEVLFQCPKRANEYTGHVRLSNIVQNISHIPPGSLKPESRVFWNPTVISLPYWSENQYLIVSRIVTDGNYQENVLCEANVCHVEGQDARPGEKPCTADDLMHVGPAGGFHDPRIFWSGKGEPLMMVNTQSRYACFGLWMIDLRTLYAPLVNLLTSSPTLPSLGPLKSYPTLTELTRNPADTRSAIEKNWMLFFPASGESYIHYDLPDPRGGPRGRTFAKLLGSGLTTTNLTDPLEQPCIKELTDAEQPDKMKRGGTWHQATNSLRLILCNRSDQNCKASSENTVFFAIVHRKFPNWLKLPLRYERFFMVWQAIPPFNMIGISQYPLLLANETASGWSASQNWDDDPANTAIVSATRKTNTNATEPYGGKDFWAYFTYTVSISYAWGRPARKGQSGPGDEAMDMNVGFLDDDVVLGIGVDDKGQAFSRVKAGDLVGCLRACPGRTTPRWSSDDFH
ncbi:hypothetical protein P7C71_g2649, partial [Lecanoromycetidae sp. Uapishka_2]